MRDLVVNALRLEAKRLGESARTQSRRLFAIQAGAAAVDLEAEQMHARRLYALADGVASTAYDIGRCDRDLLHFKCRYGHAVNHPYRCGRGMMCQECARIESARRRELYLSRITEAARKCPRHVRARMVTLTLRTRDAEPMGEAFLRVRRLAAQCFRVLWGLPHSADDWRVYFEVFPLTRGEIDKAAGRTVPGKHRRAMANRRRRVTAARRVDHAGMIRAVEFGSASGAAHVHALVLGRYVDQRQLARCWELITGSSRVCDIRAVKGGLSRGLAEVLKYITKFCGVPVDRLVNQYIELLSVAMSEEGSDSVRCHRRVEALGCLRGQSDFELEPRAHTCPTCGEDLKTVGRIPWSLRQMGVTVPPPEYVFCERAPP